MEAHVEIISTWIAGLLQRVGAQFDPEVLQWPGGSLIRLKEIDCTKLGILNFAMFPIDHYINAASAIPVLWATHT